MTRNKNLLNDEDALKALGVSTIKQFQEKEFHKLGEDLCEKLAELARLCAGCPLISFLA